jgi:hypothetical protein
MTNLLRPLRLRDFRMLFGGESISVRGDYFHLVARWMTYAPIEVPTIGGSEPAR